MQFALFAAFGVSNTIISILSFNYGLRNGRRVKACIQYGVLDSVIVAAAITVLFECLAVPLARLFGMASQPTSGDAIRSTVVAAVRIASVGYIFM
ncbi:MAG: MATE family efflux transporter, partial [Candidatus Borkfalkia sp.]